MSFGIALMGAMQIPRQVVEGQTLPARTLVPFTSSAELANVLAAAARVQELRRVHAAAGAQFAECPAAPVFTVDSSAARTGRLVIRGQVIDRSTGLPVAGVEAWSGRRDRVVTTSADGKFRLEVEVATHLNAREVTVEAARLGYGVRTMRLPAQPGSLVDVAIVLCPQPLRLEATVLSGSISGTSSVTSTQEPGVDEGDIVKRSGDYLVTLRRGRLYSVDLSGDRMRAVHAVNASRPGTEPDDAWYDELLVWGSRLVVIGYSYGRNATEFGVFDIAPDGRFAHRATYQLTSEDYYSAGNYASRLIDSRLVVYAPQSIALERDGDPLSALPTLRRWSSGGDSSALLPTSTPARVYRTAGTLDTNFSTLHTVTSCDLATDQLSCESTVVLGDPGRVFYVSPTSVYVWSVAPRFARDSATGASRTSMLFRLPLSGAAPSAVRVAGSPVDQFSFQERGKFLNVLVGSDGSGESMWSAELQQGSLAMLRVGSTAFGDGTAHAPASAYRPLPSAVRDSTERRLPLHNRFVGDYLLYGVGDGWLPRTTTRPTLVVTSVARGSTTTLPMSHGIERIEVMGRDALVVGSDSSALSFTAVRLAGTPKIAQRYTLPAASQSETRSHAFFYRADSVSARSGLLGLPVSEPPRAGSEQLEDPSGAIIFLRNDGRAIRPAGQLRGRNLTGPNERCGDNCVDWYGNSRPVFLDGRIFALLGEELIEGRVVGRRIHELRRIRITAIARD